MQVYEVLAELVEAREEAELARLQAEMAAQPRRGAREEEEEQPDQAPPGSAQAQVWIRPCSLNMLLIDLVLLVMSVVNNSFVSWVHGMGWHCFWHSEVSREAAMGCVA